MWKGKLRDGSTHEDNFREVMDQLIAISTSDVRLLEVNLETGVVYIDSKMVSRKQVMNHYGRAPYKPIQYRKMTQLINLSGSGEPDQLFEEQYIGYAYNENNLKVQVEFISDKSVESIVMKEQVTDLVDQKIISTNHTRLI